MKPTKPEIQADQLEADAKAKLAAGASAEAKQLGAEAARLRKEAGKKDAEALAQVIAFHRHLCELASSTPPAAPRTSSMSPWST